MPAGTTTLVGETERALRRLERLGSLLDSRFRLPGGFRFGLDPLLGLVPGVGDAASAIVALYIVLEAWRLGASRGTLARMLLNVGLDFAVGTIPVLGAEPVLRPGVLGIPTDRNGVGGP